jgi:hypothetical protein
MNERIGEFIKKATTVEYGVDNGFDRVTFNKEKFAELIVRECVSLMDAEKEYYSKPGMYESREYYERMRAKEDAFEDAASIIKSHFGVE